MGKGGNAFAGMIGATVGGYLGYKFGDDIGNIAANVVIEILTSGPYGRLNFLSPVTYSTMYAAKYGVWLASVTSGIKYGYKIGSSMAAWPRSDTDVARYYGERAEEYEKRVAEHKHLEQTDRETMLQSPEFRDQLPDHMARGPSKYERRRGRGGGPEYRGFR